LRNEFPPLAPSQICLSHWFLLRSINVTVKNAVRRIEVPSTLVFAARKANQLPLPTTKDGKRRFESLFKTDATLLFEVLVTRIK
jgi:hypothetical protein